MHHYFQVLGMTRSDVKPQNAAFKAWINFTTGHGCGSISTIQRNTEAWQLKTFPLLFSSCSLLLRVPNNKLSGLERR